MQPKGIQSNSHGPDPKRGFHQEDGDDDCCDSLETKEQMAWHMVVSLQDRIDALNKRLDTNKRNAVVYDVNGTRGAVRLAWQKGSVSRDQPASSETTDLPPQSLPPPPSPTTTSNERCGCVQTPHALAFRNPSLPQTDSGQKLDGLIHTYRKESDEGIDGRVQRSNKGKNKLNRIEVRKRERRKRIIQSLQRQLESISMHNLSRSVSSVIFCVKQQQSGTGVGRVNLRYEDVDASKEDWPIKLGGHDMNPELLFRLSCEKLIVGQSHKQLMKSLVLQKDFKTMLVYMYWFIHCRFFQAHSSAEQHYILDRLATLYPRILSQISLKSEESDKFDLLYRRYPFVLAKAIHLGFRYLCPGNLNLFRGSFQKVLHHSIFRLLTGVEVSLDSAETLRLEIYPEDASEEEIEKKRRRGRPIDNDPTREEEVDVTNEKIHEREGTGCGLGRPSLAIGRSRIAYVDPNMLHTRRRQTGARIESRRSNLGGGGGETDRRNQSFGKDDDSCDSILPRQPQVDFDASKISPLLQHRLGRGGAYPLECDVEESAGSMNRTRPGCCGGGGVSLKLTVPVPSCRTGGAGTYRSVSSSDVIARCDEERMRLMGRRRSVREELRRALSEERRSGRDRTRRLERECAAGARREAAAAAAVLRGGNGRGRAASQLDGEFSHQCDDG